MSTHKKLRKGSLIFLMITLILLVFIIPAPRATTADDFYRGKTLTIIVPYNPGGSNDVLARLFATYLAPKIDGNVVVKNMPAAGGYVAYNHIYQAAKPDGLTICLGATDALFAPWITAEKGVQWDPTKFEVIGTIQPISFMFMVKTGSPYISIEALKRAKGLKFGGISPLDNYTLASVVVAALLDLDAKVVSGYKGSSAILLAIIQGELHGSAFAVDSGFNYFKQGLIKPVFVIGYKKYEPWKEVPSLNELIQLSDSDRELLDLLIEVHKPWIAPPGTPKDRIEFLAKSLYEIAYDKGLSDTVKRIYNLWGGTTFN